MIKELKKLSKVGKKGSLFMGGLLFGTAGLRLLSSKEAKNIYAHTLAKSFKIKDEIDASVSTIKQHADDVYENAKDIYNQEEKNSNLGTINFDSKEELVENDDKL